jgi:hypothetical protein
MKKITIADGNIVEVKPAGNGTVTTPTSYRPERIFKDAFGNFYARTDRAWHKLVKNGKDTFEIV